MQMSPPPQAAPRPFRRSSADRVFGGVCGGLGRYWNVDPVILRVAFGVSLLFGGFGLFAYLALWVLVPDETAPADARLSDSWGLRILGAILAFVAAGIGLALLFGDANGGVLIGALVAGIVVWIAMSQRGPRPEASPPTPAGYAYGGTTMTEPLSYPAYSPVPPTPPRPRSYLGLIGLCAAITAAGLAMLMTSSPTAIMASALAALGITLMIGGFRGRARWLLIFAVPLLMLVAASSQVERAEITTGDVQWSPQGTSSYSLTAGSLDIDFSRWQGQPDGDRVTVDMGIGEVRVAAPRNWEVQLVTDLAAGSVEVDGQARTGELIAGERQIVIPATSGKPEGTLVLDVSLQAGSVQVQTDAPAAGTRPTPAPAKEKKA